MKVFRTRSIVLPSDRQSGTQRTRRGREHEHISRWEVPAFMSTHDEGRGFRSLEYHDNRKVNRDKDLRLPELSTSARCLLAAAISASREPYRQSGKRKREILAKPPSGATERLTLRRTPARSPLDESGVVLEGAKAINARHEPGKHSRPTVGRCVHQFL